MEGRKIQVMVAEDIPLLLEDFCDTVSRAGDMEITGAALTGQEITRLAQERDCDVILMDIQMPVMNGWEATKAIRRLPDPALAQIPIIAISANVFESDMRKSAESGMNAHLAKPMNVAEVLETIEELL